MKISKNTSAVLLFFYFLLSSNFLLAQCPAGNTYNTYCYAQGQPNTIAFQFCPTSGDIAQSTIIAGSVGGIFPNNGNPVPNNLTVYEGPSGSGTGGTIVFGPAATPDGGNFNGTVITASTIDGCLIFVINSIFASIACSDGLDTPLEVCSESLLGTTVTFTAPNDLCLNAGVQSGLTGGSPTGGVYSGPGVIDGGNGTTYNFNPATAGVGTHTITYTNGGSASDNIQVFAIPNVSFTALADHCIDSGIKTGLGGATPSGGIYSGPGVTDDGNGSTYSFNPGVAGLGVHLITYTESSVCMAASSDNVEVLAACGCPVGQSSYFHCSTPAEIDLVIFEVCPSPGSAVKATITQGTYTANVGNNLSVYEGASGSSTTGTLLAGPLTGNLAGTVINGNGAGNCLIFVNFIPALGCNTGFETALKVCGEDLAPSVTFTTLDDVCINEGVQTGLSGGLPVGGVYSGAGVTDSGNGSTYSFDPAIAGVGTHQLTYTAGGNSAMDDVEVFALGTAGCVSFIALSDLCLDAGVQNNISGATPTGGVYSGPGVTDSGNGSTYDFNPSSAGAGVHTISYTVGGNTAIDNVEVFGLPNVTLAIPNNQDEFCEGDAIELINFAGNPSSGGIGIYSGTGVLNLGNTISFTFNPALAGEGTHNVTYTFTDNNGCSNDATDNITVNPSTVSEASSSPIGCINTTLTNITHSTTVTTGIGSASGLPSGVTASFASNTITISGTPLESGVFNYEVPLIGGCGTATGTLTVIGTNYNLSGLQDVNVQYEGPENIISNQVIGSINSNITVSYDAGTSILLDPSFEVKQGVIFSAFIDGCGGL